MAVKLVNKDLTSNDQISSTYQSTLDKLVSRGVITTAQMNELKDFKSKAEIGDIQSYSLSLESIPTDATDSSGSTGSLDINAPGTFTKVDANGNVVKINASQKSTSLLGREVYLADYGMFDGELESDYQGLPNGRGTFHGTVSSINVSGNNLSMSVDGILFKLNSERVAEPHFGDGKTIKTAFIYYCSLAGITVAPGDVDDHFDVPIAYPGWKGNLWDYIKMFCVANAADILVGPNGNIMLKSIGERTIFVDDAAGVSRSITALGTSRTIEMYDYDCSWEDDTVIFEATTSYQLNKGEVIEELVDVTNSTTTDKIIQPLCVKSIQPIPFEGGINASPYVVLDNLNIPVEPEWWNNNGGKVSVEVSEDNPMQLKITIQAPNQENSAYVEPFRLAEYDTEARPALYICGEGVKVTKTLRKVDTGADRTFISKESKATVDNIFINNSSFHLLQSAAYATGPNIDLSLTVPFTQLENDFTEIVGARFLYDSGYYRVKTANINNSSISINARVDTRFDDIIDVYSVNFDTFTQNSGITPNNFSTFDTQYAAKFFKDFNAGYPARTFEELGDYYSDMTFNDMTINPLGDTLYKYGN